MSRGKKWLSGILLCALLLFLLRGPLFRLCCRYEMLSERPHYAITSPAFSAEVKKIAQENPGAGAQELTDLALQLTSEKLSFTSEKCAVDPNRVFASRETHCVGYAAFFCAAFNQLANARGLNCKAKPVKGELFFFGVNVHQFSSSAFFRDHDFCVIENLESGEKWCVDPSLEDYTGIGRVRGE